MSYIIHPSRPRVHFIHAPSPPHLHGDSEQQPSLGRPCTVSSAMPSPPHTHTSTPLHYVAFASYCLCIASARLALPPPLFFHCPLLVFPPTNTTTTTSSSLSLLRCRVGANQQQRLGSEGQWRDMARWVRSSRTVRSKGVVLVLARNRQ